MIDFILKIDIDLYAILMLCILLFTILIRNELLSYSNTLFRRMLFVNIVMLIFEVFSWAFNGSTQPGGQFLNYWSNAILLLFSPLIGSLWACYIDYHVFNDQSRLKRRFYYLYPMMLSFILFVGNIFTPVLFRITSENQYVREPYIWINLVSIYVIYVYLIYITLRYRKRLKKQLVVGTTLFLLLPAVGAFLQLMSLGLLLIWPLMGLALVYAYVYVERQSIAVDPLTGLYNRSKTDDYIEFLTLKNQPFTMMMIDLDDFKYVNDEYGHIAGDHLLVRFSRLLLDELGKDGHVFRFGGDEFFIVSSQLDKQGMIDFINLIQEKIVKIKDLKHIEELEFSYGIHEVINPATVDLKRYFVIADNSMYEQKAKSKNYKRRKDD